MADTLNDALGISDPQVLVIDNDLRTIKIPDNFVLGVYNDKNTHKVSFQAPRMYGLYDLSGFSIRVNFQNANGDGSVYDVTDAAVSGSNITFSWLVDAQAYRKAGNVLFVVCFYKKDSDDVIANEFNTTTATVRVLPGYENDAIVSEATIIPGTTPTLFINVAKEVLANTSSARIDVMQYQVTSGSGSNTLLFQKDATVGETSITYTLSQDDTYLMQQGTLKIQAHGLLKDGTAWKTQVFTIKVGESIANTVIS